jgi:hypothetical protein
MGDGKKEALVGAIAKGHHDHSPKSTENSGSVVYKYGVLGLACWFWFGAQSIENE